jgi:hypothetical protein|eukprot:SAG25_NODE_4268_length_851_cov_1.928191_1_plen_69_part_00
MVRHCCSAKPERRTRSPQLSAVWRPHLVRVRPVGLDAHAAAAAVLAAAPKLVATAAAVAFAGGLRSPR